VNGCKTAQQISHDLEKILKLLNKSLLDLIGLTPLNSDIQKSKLELSAFSNSFSVIVKRVKTRFLVAGKTDGK
jgi:hypothetical protein